MRIEEMGLTFYEPVWNAMKDFTQHRTSDTPDELWLLEHHPVYTQGQAGKAEHILNPLNIPIIQSDRGGQVTYHGPGQMVAYILMDIQRIKLGIRSLVSQLEHILISLLKHFNLEASLQCGAPGVYINEKKIASIGLRVKNGCTYHGIALNVNMDLEPFSRINPCGFTQLQMTQLHDFYPTISILEVQKLFINEFTRYFN